MAVRGGFWTPSQLNKSKMTIIALGTYSYFTDGQPTNITESWSIESMPDTYRRIHSERKAPSFGSHINVESIHKPGGHITAFTVTWRNTSPGMVAEATAAYSIDDTIHVERTIEGKTHHEKQSAPANLVVMPLMRIYTGFVIYHLQQNGGAAPVLVPNITDPTNHDLLLTPLLETRQAQKLHHEDLQLNDQPLPCAVYQYTGGNYDSAARFWVTSSNLLARYTFQNWDVRLSKLQLFPDDPDLTNPKPFSN